MSLAFIELYNPKPSWSALSRSAQEEFMKAVTGHVEGAVAAGVEILAFGTNEASTSRRSPYEYFCVYRLPHADLAREFENLIEASGWYDYFEQTNLCGKSVGVAEHFHSHISR